MDVNPKRTKRAVSGNGAVLQSHRMAKGWTVEQLAHEADVAPKTIGRLENGDNGYINTWHAVAKALDLDVNTLLPFEELSKLTKIVPQTRITVTAKVDIPNESLDKAERLLKWLTELINAIGAKASIDVIDHFEGSTYIRLSMRVDDFQAMCELFLSGELAERGPDLRVLAIFASDLREANAFENSHRRGRAALAAEFGIELDDDTDALVRRRPDDERRQKKD